MQLDWPSSAKSTLRTTRRVRLAYARPIGLDPRTRGDFPAHVQHLAYLTDGFYNNAALGMIAVLSDRRFMLSRRVGNSRSRSGGVAD